MNNVTITYTNCAKCGKVIEDEKPIISKGEITRGGTTIVYRYICFACFAKDFNSEEEAIRKFGRGGLRYYA